MSKANQIARKLASEIDAGAWPAGANAPTVLGLSQKFGIAPNTANRVLKMLCAMGYIEKPAGAKQYRLAPAVMPYRLGAGGKSDDAICFEKDASGRARDIADTLRTEILLGAYDDGTIFPQNAEIQSRFGASYRTAAASVRLLEQAGFLKRRGAKCYVHYHHVNTRKRVSIVGRSSIVGHLPYERFIDGAQKQLARLGWPPLDIRFIISDKKTLLPSPSEVSGFVAIDDAGFRLLQTSRTLETPLIGLDSSGIALAGSLRRNIAVIGPDHELSGRDVARYLATSGNKRIAFFSHLPLSEPWLQQRLAGITSVYKSSAQEAFSLAVYAKHVSIGVPAVGGFQRALTSDIGKFSGWENWEELFPKFLFQKYFYRNGYHILWMIALAAKMRAMFEKALLDKEITAWVCANDELAIVACEFLQQMEKIKRRRLKIALIGFDNNPMTPLPGISTYDLRYDLMGRLAIECIAHPQALFGRRTNRKILTPGTLVLRSSTGKQ